MTDILDLAKYLLYLGKKEAEQAGEEAVSEIDPMKLQKLLYYCQGYSLGTTGRALFEDEIEAWKYGPVVRSVYKEYQRYRGSWIPLNLVASPPEMGDYVSHIAKLVMRDKGQYSATALMKMTHKEPAWQEAWQRVMKNGSDLLPGESLSLETMRNYFSRELDDEMSSQAEDDIWDSVGREPTPKEWSSIAEWVSDGFTV
jgi:uncharacterized phage-associated protein